MCLASIKGNEFGEFIKCKRNEKGYTQEQLTNLSGLSSGYISRIENGLRSNISLEMVQSLMIVLEIDCLELFQVAFSTKE